MDHVLLKNGEFYRVLGNSSNEDYFLGYNVYSPVKSGDRIYLGKKYQKNFIEDEKLPEDVMETYEYVPTNNIVKRFCPIKSVKQQYDTFKDTIWGETYRKLTNLFGEDKVGIFGSSMMGMHLNIAGKIRKDIDYMVEGLDNLRLLKNNIGELRKTMGFVPISTSRIEKQYKRYSRVFNLEHNSLKRIIGRRWTALQLSPEIVSTLRFRDKGVQTDYSFMKKKRIKKNITLEGVVFDDLGQSNLFPRNFFLKTQTEKYQVSLFWWKYCSPVESGESVIVRGDLVDDVGTHQHVVVTNFRNHGIKLLRQN